LIKQSIITEDMPKVTNHNPAPTDGISAKQAAIMAAMQQIQKQYGTGSIMKLGERAEHLAIDVIPTGSIALDLALGVGGLPKGRIIEIFGPEASGKTSICLHVIAKLKKRVEWQLLLMQSMLLIRKELKKLELI
jgi:predicted ATP-dependent serine protease